MSNDERAPGAVSPGLQSMDDPTPKREQPSRYPVAIYKLLCLLKVVRKALSAELCKDQPKSIWTKADDIDSILTDWIAHARELRQEPGSFPDHDQAVELLSELRQSLSKASKTLAPLVQAKIVRDAEADLHWGEMLKSVSNTRDAIKLGYPRILPAADNQR